MANGSGNRKCLRRISAIPVSSPVMPIRLLRFPDPRSPELKPGQPDGVFRSTIAGPLSTPRPISATFAPFWSTTSSAGCWSSEFGPDKVRHVRNLTDVDDRTIGQARKENRPLGRHHPPWTEKFHADCAALNCLPPHVGADRDRLYPRAGRHDRRAHAEGQRLPRRRRLGLLQGRLLSRTTARCRGSGSASSRSTNTAFDADHKDDVGDFALWKA